MEASYAVKKKIGYETKCLEVKYCLKVLQRGKVSEKK